MLNECNGCEYQCNLSHIDICTLGSPCPHQRSTPMTNEEWLRQATTDEMTEIFMRFMFDAEFKARFVNGNFINEFRKWIKEKHESEGSDVSVR